MFTIIVASHILWTMYIDALAIAGCYIWVSRKTPCMGRPRRPTLSLLEDQGIAKYHEKPRRATYHPWDDGDPMFEPKPPGDPTLRG